VNSPIIDSVIAKREHLGDIGHLGGMSKSNKKKAAARANLVKANKARAAKESFMRQDKAIKRKPSW
jgi:hypothetical protein